jgi:hypothetical protein
VKLEVLFTNLVISNLAQTGFSENGTWGYMFPPSNKGDIRRIWFQWVCMDLPYGYQDGLGYCKGDRDVHVYVDMI